ncbi:MAG: hypothetical protein ACYC26_07210 [Phycisphaerales bacterium]
MVKTDAIAGIVNDQFRFHYDIFADVLYIRLLSAERLTTYGDVTDEGDILLRDEQTDRAVGLTVVSWWKRYGAGTLPDSIREIQKRIEPLTGKMAA